MTERAASRAALWCRATHGEKNTAEGCIDPPAARSRRRRAPRRATYPLAPLRPTVTAAAAATPNPKRLARFARFDPPDSFSSLLSLVRTFRFTLAALRPALTPRRPTPPYAPPYVARMSTMPLAAIYPNRANAQTPWLSPPTVRPAATRRTPLSRPLALSLLPRAYGRNAAGAGGECTTRYDAAGS